MTTRFVETSLLRIGYEVAGPDGGFPVILTHGWPDDARTWDRVLPALHEAGFRTYTPWLRGDKIWSSSRRRSISGGMPWLATTGARAPCTSRPR